MFSDTFVIYLVLAWIGASLIGGAALAGLAKRIHSSISFKKNWLYFSVLLALAMGAFFGIALH